MLTFSQISKSYAFDRGYCHNRVNQIGQQSRLNLTSVLEQKHAKTISLPRIKSSFNQKEKNQTKVNQKKSLLSKTKIITNPQFDEMESSKIEKSIILTKKIKQLKEMQLMDKNRLRLMRYENQNKRSAIMNDFHSPKTNGGFSRSKTGGIYYK